MVVYRVSVNMNFHFCGMKTQEPSDTLSGALVSENLHKSVPELLFCFMFPPGTFESLFLLKPFLIHV